MWSSENSICLCYNPKRIQLLKRSRLGLRHLREHKFKHNFQDTLNPICNCDQGIETSCHYLLHCSLFTDERLAPLNVTECIDNSIVEIGDFNIVEVLLYGRIYQVTPTY